MPDIQLLQNVELPEGQRLADEGSQRVRSPLKGCAEQESPALVCGEDAVVGAGVEEHEGEEVPADAADGLEVVFEVVGVEAGEGDGLGVEVEEVLPLLLLYVLLLGVLAALAELLVILDQLVDQFLRLQLLLPLLDLLRLQLLSLLDQEDLFVVVLLLVSLLLESALWLFAHPFYSTHFVVAHLE